MDSLRRRVAERLAVSSSPTSEAQRSVSTYSESNLRQVGGITIIKLNAYTIGHITDIWHALGPESRSRQNYTP